MQYFTSYMSLALEEAKKAADKEEFPVGAVVISPDNEVISQAHNRTRELDDPTAHAEILALRAAANKLGNERLVGCNLYVTLEPCTMCAGAISHARIKRLYYALEDEKGGAISNGVRFLDHKNCLYKTEYYYGFEAEKSKKIIDDFIGRLRVDSF
ncbi:MAG: nucleoside deaminase [Pseudomonadota bacterium]